MFRFLPNDREIKVAHARCVVDTFKAKKIALIGDTTAYGQGGFQIMTDGVPARARFNPRSPFALEARNFGDKREPP